jgi:hypothetical protein
VISISESGIRDAKKSESGINISDYISESLVKFFWVKILKFFVKTVLRIRIWAGDGKFRSVMEKSRSGISPGYKIIQLRQKQSLKKQCTNLDPNPDRCLLSFPDPDALIFVRIRIQPFSSVFYSDYMEKCYTILGRKLWIGRMKNWQFQQNIKKRLSVREICNKRGDKARTLIHNNFMICNTSLTDFGFNSTFFYIQKETIYRFFAIVIKKD